MQCGRLSLQDRLPHQTATVQFTVLPLCVFVLEEEGENDVQHVFDILFHCLFLTRSAVFVKVSLVVKMCLDEFTVT